MTGTGSTIKGGICSWGNCKALAKQAVGKAKIRPEPYEQM